MKIQLECKNCGKLFFRDSCKIHGKNNFCSRECQFTFVKYIPNGFGNEEIKCNFCGNLFLSPISNRRKGTNSRFCSLKCRNLALSLLNKKEIIILKCSVCGKDFQREAAIERQSRKIFNKTCCSRKCAVVIRHESDKLKKRLSYFVTQAIRSKASGNRKNIDITITIDDVIEQWNKQDGKCAISGIPLILKPIRDRGKAVPNQASLDRIDSSLGYCKGNIQFISLIANYAKNKFSTEDVIQFCRDVLNAIG